MELLCYECLLDGRVVASTELIGGTSSCGKHTGVGAIQSPETLCQRCEVDGLHRHRAWTVRRREPLCIYHAVDGALGDDMNEHNRFVTIYEELRQKGHTDAY